MPLGIVLFLFLSRYMNFVWKEKYKFNQLNQQTNNFVWILMNREFLVLKILPFGNKIFSFGI